MMTLIRSLGRHRTRQILEINNPRSPLRAMDPLINLMNHFKREREYLREQREMLRTRKFTTHDKTEQGYVDTTADSIALIDRVLADLDRIVTDYEGRSKHR